MADRAGAGRSYDQDGFGMALDAVRAGRDAYGEAGLAYVRRECSFDAFDERLERLVEATVDA